MSNEMTRTGDSGGEMVREEPKSLTAAMSSAAVEEVRAAFTMARTFPRDEDLARQKVIKVCKSPVFVAKSKAMYKFKVGGSEVTGLSINVAKEMARAMGNMRYGSYIIHDTVDDRTIRCWAIDLESNTRSEVDDTFRKMVFRKNKSQDPTENAGGYWKPVDERELLMLSNLKASKGIRNCILNLVPFEIREVAIETIGKTVQDKAAEDPGAFLRELKDGFAEHNVRPDELRDYCLAFKQDLDKLPPKWMSYLRSVLNGLDAGESSWGEYLSKAADKLELKGGAVTANDLASKVAAKAASVTAEKKDDTPPQDKPPTTTTAKKDERPADEATPKDGGTSGTATPTRKREKPAATSPDDISDGIV